MSEPLNSDQWQAKEQLVFDDCTRPLRRFVGEYIAHFGGAIPDDKRADICAEAVSVIAQVNARHGHPLSDRQLDAKARQWVPWWIDRWHAGKADAPFTAARRRRGNLHSAQSRAETRRQRRKQLAYYFELERGIGGERYSTAWLAERFGCSVETIRLDRLAWRVELAARLLRVERSTVTNLLSGGVATLKRLAVREDSPPDSKLGAVEKGGDRTQFYLHRWRWACLLGIPQEEICCPAADCWL